MTPAVRAVKGAGIRYEVHSYEHDAAARSYGEEAADKLGVPAVRVFKTLIVAIDGGSFGVAVIPVSANLSLKRFAAAVGAKRVEMAAQADAERMTGYVLGGISPIGQKRLLTTLIDSSAESFPTIYVSAGRRGLELELAPEALRMLTEGAFAELI